jgi:hypothetical protein
MYGHTTHTNEVTKLSGLLCVQSVLERRKMKNPCDVVNQVHTIYLDGYMAGYRQATIDVKTYGLETVFNRFKGVEMKTRDEWYETVWVMTPCRNEWVSEELVEFIDISEDIQGRDLLTYKCPFCAETHTSLRCGR